MWHPRENVGALELTILKVSLNFFFEFDELCLNLVVYVAFGGSRFNGALCFRACECYDIALDSALVLHTLAGANDLSNF